MENNELDPVVRLLRQGLEYKTSQIDHRIDNIKAEIVNDILAQAMPDYLSVPVPFMAMLQVDKKDVRESDKDPIVNTQGTTFSMDIKENSKTSTYQFMPLIDANIIKGHVADIRKGQLENTWIIDIETGEWVDNLSGMTVFIKEDGVPIEHIELSIGEYILPVVMMSDFNRLPFSEVIHRYMQYGGNEQLYKLLMHWHDVLCQKAFSYCIVHPYNSKDIPLGREGSKIHLRLSLYSKKRIEKLNIENVLLNCIPIINAKEGSRLIDEIKQLDLEEGKLLLADDVDNNPFLKKRQYGTTRECVETNKEVYLALHTSEDQRKYDFIHYIATTESVPIKRGYVIKSASSEFLPPVIVETFPNNGLTADNEHLNGVYHLQTHDRMVTPTDILRFCKTKLIMLFGYEESQIKRMEWNRKECQAEILIEGKKEIEEEYIQSQESALEAMLLKRSALLMPININLTYLCKQ